LFFGLVCSGLSGDRPERRGGGRRQVNFFILILVRVSSGLSGDRPGRRGLSGDRPGRRGLSGDRPGRRDFFINRLE